MKLDPTKKTHDEMQRYPNLLFDEATEHCAALCKCLLKHCSSSIAQVMSDGTLYWNQQNLSQLVKEVKPR